MRPYILVLLAAATVLAGCASEKQCPGWPDKGSDVGVHGPASGS